MTNDATNYQLPWCEVVEGVTPREVPVIVGHALRLIASGFSGQSVDVFGMTCNVPDVWISKGDQVYQVRFPRFTGNAVRSAKIVGDDLIVVIE